MNSNPTITVAVTGASGLLGRPLLALLESDSRYRVMGAAWSRAGGGLDRIDITDPAAVDAWLDEVKPDVLPAVSRGARTNPTPLAVDRQVRSIVEIFDLQFPAQVANVERLLPNANRNLE